MGLFSKILGKLGLGKKDDEKDDKAPTTAGMSGGPKPAPAATTAAKPAAAPAKPSAPAKPAAPAKPSSVSSPNVAPPPPSITPPAPKPAAVSEVDVVKKLEGLAAEKPMKLNWKTSIADLLFLLDIDNSYEARKELAEELGCPPELMGDSAKMNTWLHKEVLRQIAQNGGNIPKELLD